LHRGLNDHRNPFGFIFDFAFALIGWMGGRRRDVLHYVTKPSSARDNAGRLEGANFEAPILPTRPVWNLIHTQNFQFF
jgi:hypothetical protein